MGINEVQVFLHAHYPIFSLTDEKMTQPFFERLTDSYIPTFMLLSRNNKQPVAMSVTPTFLFMIQQEELYNIYKDYLKRKIKFANHERKFNKLAFHYTQRYERVLAFVEEFENILHVIKELYNEGKLSLLIKYANGIFNTYSNCQWAKEAQIQYSMDVLGFNPKAFWMRSMTDQHLLLKYEAEYVLIEQDTCSSDIIRTNKELQVSAINHTVAKSLRSKIEMFSKDQAFLNKEKDIAYERGWGNLQSFFENSELRLPLGISYIANSSHEYELEKAYSIIDDYVFQVMQEMNQLNTVLSIQMERLGYDWDEGVLFLEKLLSLLPPKSPPRKVEEQLFLPIVSLEKWSANVNNRVAKLFDIEKKMQDAVQVENEELVQHLFSRWLCESDDILFSQESEGIPICPSFPIEWPKLFSSKRACDKELLWISTEFPPGIIGGLGTHVNALSKALVQNGWKITVITLGAIGAPSYENVNGVEVYRVSPYHPSESTLIEWNIRVNMAFMEKAKEIGEKKKFTLIHAHDWLVYIATSQLKKEWQTPLVSTIHATEKGRHLGKELEGDSVKVHQIEERLCRESDKIIVCSEFMKTEIKATFNVPLEKMNVIPNGINQRQTVHNERTNNTYQVAAIGRLVPEKGFQYYIEAAAKVIHHYPNIHFSLAGVGPYKKALQRLVKELRLEENFSFIGFLHEHEKRRLLKESDIVVVPSLYEPFGIVALEAMEAGCVTIATNIGGLSSIIDHEIRGLLVQPKDSNALSDAICRVIQSPDLAKNFKKNAQQKIKTFSWDSIATKTGEVYAETILKKTNLQTTMESNRGE